MANGVAPRVAGAARALWLGAASLCMAATLSLGAQEAHSLSAERSFDFKTGKVFDVGVQIGQVTIASVEFQNMGRGYGQGGFAPRVRGTDSEASTTIRTHLLAENPTTEKWEVSFTLEFLDRNGKLIDRVTKKSKWDHEAKPYDLDHELLEYVVPMIGQVRIRLEGKH
jgi:hypothetical protein